MFFRTMSAIFAMTLTLLAGFPAVTYAADLELPDIAAYRGNHGKLSLHAARGKIPSACKVLDAAGIVAKSVLALEEGVETNAGVYTSFCTKDFGQVRARFTMVLDTNGVPTAANVELEEMKNHPDNTEMPGLGMWARWQPSYRRLIVTNPNGSWVKVSMFEDGGKARATDIFREAESYIPFWN